MQITHEQAQQLIQWKIDKALSLQDEAALSAHLHDCTACQDYAAEMMEVEGLLSPLMKRQWSLQPLPLPVLSLVQRKNSFISVSALLAIRRAAAGVLVAAFFFSAWQFTRSNAPSFKDLTAVGLPVPTPSASTTQAHSTLMDCEIISYTAAEADTLSRLAEQFSVAEEELVALNSLETNAIEPGMKLLVPVCQLTATHTVSPATLTTTHTPRVGSSHTPGPGG